MKIPTGSYRRPGRRSMVISSLKVISRSPVRPCIMRGRTRLGARLLRLTCPPQVCVAPAFRACPAPPRLPRRPAPIAPPRPAALFGLFWCCVGLGECGQWCVGWCGVWRWLRVLGNLRSGGKVGNSSMLPYG
ncbi:hypothetical protein ES703_46555 [subsurface metagenome]